MAQVRGEWTWKAVTLLDKQVGGVSFRLVAEQDSAAADPDTTTRLRFGRVFETKGEGMIRNGITLTASNVDAYLEVMPEILAMVAKYRGKLPKTAVKVTKTSVASESEAKLAALFGTAPVVAAAPAQPATMAGAGKKRQF